MLMSGYEVTASNRFWIVISILVPMMIDGIVDTTVVVHLFRRYAPAVAWYRTQPEVLGVTSVTRLEVIYGAGSKAKLRSSLAILDQFAFVYLTASDQEWSIEQLKLHRLSKGATTFDCLIASVSHRLQAPLYTHNLKDMQILVGDLAVKPYV